MAEDDQRSNPFAAQPARRGADGSSTAPGLPGPWLVADIGGTNARFGWVDAGAAGVEHVATMPAAEHAGPADAALAYLRSLSQTLGPRWRPPRAGAFAVATAVGGDRVEFTNSHWAFARGAAQRALGLDELLLLNDFEALALALPRLRASQIRPFGAAVRPPTPETLAVIRPGTGLGEAAAPGDARRHRLRFRPRGGRHRAQPARLGGDRR